MGHSVSQTPEALLAMALNAGTASMRAKYATHGLRHPALGRDTQVLLLRQLYLAHLEREQFVEARAVAEQMVSLGELPEPALHDAARACIALGDWVAAAGHLRVAARTAPATRRALHLSALARVLFANEQYLPAKRAAQRALRWARDHQPVYRAQVALAAHRAGDQVDLLHHYDQLATLEPLPLFAEYLAAELLLELDLIERAVPLLRQFVDQARRSSLELSVGLRAEIRRAEDLLSESGEVSTG